MQSVRSGRREIKVVRRVLDVNEKMADENRALFDSLLEALQAGRDADEATRMAFGEVDLDGMTRALREHVLSL